VVLLLALSASSLPLLGAVWTTDGMDSLLAQLDRIEFEDVSIRQDGIVTLAPGLEPVPVGEEAAMWRTVYDRRGYTYVATGNRGRLFRLRTLPLAARPSSPELVFDAGTGEILSLCADSSGVVYFGTTPDGRVYRVPPAGKPELLCATQETYIFSLLPGPQGTLYCATGEHGRLLRIDSRGRSTVVFSAPQAHLTELAWLPSPPARARHGASGIRPSLLAGTSPDGVVYCLDLDPTRPGPTSVAVLYDTPLNEIRAILADERGGVYVGANAGPDSDSGRAAAYYIDESGVCRWTWSCPDSTIYSLALHASPDVGNRAFSSILVSTGGKAMVYELDTLGRASVAYRFVEGQVLSIYSPPAATRGATARLFTTGNPGRLYSTGAGYADSGTVTSPPQDCANPARFGRLSFRARVPAGTGVTFETRSGNSEKPDSTWSQWAQASPDIASPSRRFIQWRARLRSTFAGLTPELRRVDVYYGAANLAPVVRKLEMSQPAPEDAKKGANKPVRQITWEVSDPDSDSLSYSLFFRPEGEQGWQKLGQGARPVVSPFELETRALPDGWYELRLVASDQPAHGAGVELTAERVSSPFLVDNSSPAVLELKTAPPEPGSGRCRVTFTAQDALSPIAAARVSVNAGDWLAVDPEDGLCDSNWERFATYVKLSAGDNAVAVWVADAQGNVTASRTTVRF
jgi:hypothetical protein